MMTTSLVPWLVLLLASLLPSVFSFRTTTTTAEIQKRPLVTATWGSTTPLSTADAAARSTTSPLSLSDYLDQHPGVPDDLASVLLAVATSCRQIARRLATLPLDREAAALSRDPRQNVQGETQKGMDVIANDIFLHHLSQTTAVAAMASEEEETVVWTEAYRQWSSSSSNQQQQTFYEIAFDPLDGSSNLDINIPTGSIFGISPLSNPDAPFTSATGRESLVAAGYALYSSSTEFVVAVNGTVVGFTLNPHAADNEEEHTDDPAAAFHLSRADIRCPPRGPYYSLNEAREPDWPAGLRRWIADAKRGKTPAQTVYSARYVCSFVADVHRTLLQGGWAGNPRPHLRLLYEAAPVAWVVETAGGRASDGQRHLLDWPAAANLHQRVCVFAGSRDDVDDLLAYGDIQQGSATYQA